MIVKWQSSGSQTEVKWQSSDNVTMKWKYNGSSLVVKWHSSGDKVSVSSLVLKWQSSASQVEDEWPLSGITMAVKWLRVGGVGLTTEWHCIGSKVPKIGNEIFPSGF